MSGKQRKGQLRSDVYLTLLAYFLSYPALYVFHILLSRSFGVEGYGNLSVARSLAAIFATLALFGTDKACLRFLPVYRDRNEAHYGKGFIYFALATIILISLVLTACGYGLLLLPQHWLGCDDHPAMYAMLLVAPMSLAFFLTKLYASQGRGVMASLLQEIMLPIILIVLVILGLKLWQPFTEIRAVIMAILGYVVLGVMLLAFIWTVWCDFYQSVQAEYRVREWFSTSSSFLFSAVTIRCMLHGGILVLEAMNPDEESVGLFAAAMFIASFGILALRGVRLVGIPALAVRLENQDSEETVRCLRFYVRLLLVIAIILFLISAVFGQQILDIFGAGFKSGHSLLIVLGIGNLFIMPGGLAVPILLIRKKGRFVFYSMLALLVLHAVLLVILIPFWGAMGAAIAFTASFAVVYSLQVFWVQKVCGIPYFHW